DGNGSHASTLKSPSYTKSVSWQHYPAFGTVCNWLEKYRKYIAKMLSFEKIKIVFLCRIKAPFQHHHYQH
ncbi:hypothetical protein, partial [Escherichia coli]